MARREKSQRKRRGIMSPKLVQKTPPEYLRKAQAHLICRIDPDGDLDLSSGTKCNTPTDLIIGTADQDVRECCHAMLFAFVG